ncbi:MAG: pirin family protein [Chloroflexota bacterium]
MRGTLCEVRNVFKGQPVRDGAGVKIHRVIGSSALNHSDPFVLLDEIRSDNPEDYIAGFPTHPHRGIETITYMMHGRFRHRDSRGGGGLLTDGSVQWMTAGRGILHSEMPEAVEGEACGYQLWLSLPAKDKMVEPSYQHLAPEMIPVVVKDGVRVQVISGEYRRVRGPARNLLRTHYFDCDLPGGTVFTFDLNPEMNSLCYIHSGSVVVYRGGSMKKIGDRMLIQFSRGSALEIAAGSVGARFLFLAAKPNNEPIVRGGPFVMNTAEELGQAFVDYQNGMIG